MRIESDDCYRLGQHYACDGCGCFCHERPGITTPWPGDPSRCFRVEIVPDDAA